MSVNSNALLNRLLKNLPELQFSYNEYEKKWHNEFPGVPIGLYDIFDDIVWPYVVKVLSSKNLDKIILGKIFSFLEEMASDSDNSVKIVARVTILEGLVANTKMLKRAYHYMGPNTIKMIRKIEDFNILDELINNIPELDSKYRLYLKQWSDKFPGLHNIFGDVFNVYLMDQLSLRKLNENLLRRIFDFLESMASNSDEDIRNVLYVTILERLGDDAQILKTAYKYMGPKTMKMSQEIENYWGRTHHIF